MRSWCWQYDPTHAHSGDVAIVVNEIPLSRDQIQAQDVVVDFVGELVEAAEGIDLVVANICDRGIDEAGGLGANCGDHLGFVAIAHASATARRAG